MSAISDELKKDGFIKLGIWTIKIHYQEELDWNYYSKAWHRAHGPKRTIYDREIVFSRQFRGKEQKKYINLESFRGNIVENAILAHGLEPKRSKHSLKIRLHKAYDSKLIDEKRGYRIYSRTLLGEHIDYVIQSPLGMVYHDKYRENLVKGLHKKIRHQSRKLKGLIDFKFCKKLGFCDEGIKSFCSIFGFDLKGSYTPEEVENAVKQNLSAASPFVSELRTLANALGYKITISY